ncbi:hypothetical protein MANES_12G101202v8 [Manihot esculenta]|uniref:Uncharacterized protein n=1 Tax=Manihot esculenta TaxID=3983 RepID=A0ACB7GQG3_MANES|nr:hypothetical protein MANES_12G101202v8 [Manihot esculenta]
MIGLYHFTSSLSQVPIPLPHTASHLPTSLSLKPQSQLKHADGRESLLTVLVPSPFSSFSSVPQPRPPTHPVASPAATHPPTDPPTCESQPESLLSILRVFSPAATAIHPPSGTFPFALQIFRR